MKRLIKSASSISEKYVKSPVSRLEDMLGVGWGSSMSLRKISQGNWNFVISDRYKRLTQSDEIISRLKHVGAKYISPRYGDVYFYFDLSKYQEEYKAEKQAAEDEYRGKLNAVDISMYKPTDAIIKKIMDYRAKGSKVNVKAIKDPKKLLTYYYTAELIGWDDLSRSIWKIAQYDYPDEMHAIDHQIEKDESYKDSRSVDEVELGLGDSKGLFTFDQRRRNGGPDCWLPKSILQYFIDNDIPVHFSKRTSGAEYDRNGAQWSEVEHLTLFPGTQDELKYNIVVHTHEGDGATTYSSRDTSERVSAKQVIEGLDRRLKRAGLVQ